jgi:hypothetical protein
MPITDKQLKDKAIDIKGKDYVMVKDRVIYFNETYPNGSIETGYERVGDCYEFYAKITPDTKNPTRYFTGHSAATIGEGMINKTAAMENAETSAVGRAFAFMGIGVIDSIASVDEMNKAGANGTKKSPKEPKAISGDDAINMLATKTKWERDKVIIRLKELGYIDANGKANVSLMIKHGSDKVAKMIIGGSDESK